MLDLCKELNDASKLLDGDSGKCVRMGAFIYLRNAKKELVALYDEVAQD